MQMVILAGGLATRLGEISAKRPKSMTRVHGRPFIEHQIDLVRACGVTRFVLCVGHLGAQIRDHLGDGSRFGVRIAYSDEGETLLGTGGALKKAAPLLEECFCLMWGDSYLMLDYGDVARMFRDRESEALMVVYRNENRGDRSNVALRAGKVTCYDKWRDDSDMIYIDNGLSLFSKRVLDRIPGDRPYGVEQVFKELAEDGLLDAYVTTQRFYEIGSASGIEELERFLARDKE